MKKPQHEVTHTTDEFPTSLYSVEDVAERTGMPVERLVSLTEAGYLPHFCIDGTVYRYKIKEVKDWLARNCVYEHRGRPLEKALQIVYPAPLATDKPPRSISNIEALQQMPKYGYQPGVYFLCKGDEVVYVGQSKTPSARVGTHTNDPKKDFDRVYLLGVGLTELDRVEAAFIEFLKPKHNGRMHSKKGTRLMRPEIPNGTNINEIVGEFASANS